MFAPPYPFYAHSGQGARLTDVDGQSRLDYLNNYTSLLHGHAYPAIAAAAKRQIDLGTSFPAPTELEIEFGQGIPVRAVRHEDQRKEICI